MSEVEILSPNDVISCLWNKNAAEKCFIGLGDVLIYERGQPLRWYYTGKNGEVLKKRAVDILPYRVDGNVLMPQLRPIL